MYSVGAFEHKRSDQTLLLSNESVQCLCSAAPLGASCKPFVPRSTPRTTMFADGMSACALVQRRDEIASLRYVAQRCKALQLAFSWRYTEHSTEHSTEHRASCLDILLYQQIHLLHITQIKIGNSTG